jgi:hypothetical protein
LVFIAAAIAFVVVAGIWSSYVVFEGAQPLMVMLALVAAITYFGLLAIPGGWGVDTGFTEARIRLALASTFVMVYLVYLSTVIFWTVPEEPRQTYAKDMVGTLTDLIKIVLPFYFGASSAVEIAKSRSKERGSPVGSQAPEGTKEQS